MKVSHRLTDSGVVLHVREGTLVRLHTVTDAEARRLAWALLADLEPEEQPVSAVRPRRRGEAPTRLAVLASLMVEPGTRHEISSRAGFTITIASIIQAADRGLVRRVEPIPHARALATYQITEAGRAEFARVSSTEREQA